MSETLPIISIPEQFRIIARERASQPAITSAGDTLSFAEIDATSDAIAGHLNELGINKGDRVGLYSINSKYFPCIYLGILKAGATVVPINVLLKSQEISYILDNAGVRYLFYYDGFYETVSTIRETRNQLCGCCSVGTNKSDPSDKQLDELLCERPAPEITINPRKDLAAIIYTSGTTGVPKGAMLSHYNLVSNTFGAREAVQLQAGHDRLLVVLPMFHSFAATVGMLLPLLHGAALVPLARFEPDAVANAIAEQACTIFMGVPSMYSLLLRLPEAFTEKFSSLRICISGGAAMPVEVMKQFEQRFNLPIHEGDGPTECSPVTCLNPLQAERKPGSVGLPIPHVEMCIKNAEGQDLPAGEFGEICVRGPNVMLGYLGLKDETSASFFGNWFRTGDLGYVDDDGYFFIVDRIKDMLIVNGMNVYPRMIEEVLYQIDELVEAAVIGEPHKLHGEIPVAYVAVKPGSEISEKRIKNYCRENLGQHQAPRKVYFMENLPKNATGKILKRELRRQGELERGVDL